MRDSIAYVLALFVSLTAATVGAAEAVRAVPIDAGVRRTLQTHCFACHTAEDAESGFDIEMLISREADLASLAHWQLVLTMIRSGDMPPQGEQQPSIEQRDTLFKWIESASAALVDPDDPGPTVLRRLTRREVENTIRELTGVAIPVSGLLPNEGVGGEGFASVGAIQRSSAETLEAQLEVAWYLADRLLLTSDGARFTPSTCRTPDEAIEAVDLLFRQRVDAWWHDSLRRLFAASREVADKSDAHQVATGFHLPPDLIQEAAILLAEPLPAWMTELSANELSKRPNGYLSQLKCFQEGWSALDALPGESEMEREMQLRLLADAVVAIRRGGAWGRKGDAPPMAERFDRVLAIPSRDLKLTGERGNNRNWSARWAPAEKQGRVAHEKLLVRLTPPQRAEYDAIVRDAAVVYSQFFLEIAEKSRQKREPPPWDSDKLVQSFHDAEPRHVEWLMQFAPRAWRRPLTKTEQDAVRDFYAQCRGGVDHQQAIRMSPARHAHRRTGVSDHAKARQPAS